EHVLFHWCRRAGLLRPRLVDIDVAGRAGTGPAALGLDAGHAVLDRRFHHGRSDFGLDGTGSAVRIDIGDLGHYARVEPKKPTRPGENGASYNGSRRVRHPRPAG